MKPDTPSTSRRTLSEIPFWRDERVLRAAAQIKDDGIGIPILVGRPEEVRMKVITDYGRSKGMAWYMLGGWKINWETVADCRIIKWDSAA